MNTITTLYCNEYGNWFVRIRSIAGVVPAWYEDIPITARAATRLMRTRGWPVIRA